MGVFPPPRVVCVANLTSLFDDYVPFARSGRPGRHAIQRRGRTKESTMTIRNDATRLLIATWDKRARAVVARQG